MNTLAGISSSEDPGRVETDDPGTAPDARRPWYRIEQVEIRWLPVGEAAFLLWVLVALIVVWLVVVAAVRLL